MSRELQLAPSLIDEITAIWQWNAERYGDEHADRYIAFLYQGIEELRTRWQSGERLKGRNDTYFILLQRRTARHGHVVVYRCQENLVQVEHIFHTAQNWQEMLGIED